MLPCGHRPVKKFQRHFINTFRDLVLLLSCYLPTHVIKFHEENLYKCENDITMRMTFVHGKGSLLSCQMTFSTTSHIPRPSCCTMFMSLHLFIYSSPQYHWHPLSCNLKVLQWLEDFFFEAWPPLHSNYNLYVNNPHKPCGRMTPKKLVLNPNSQSDSL